MNCGWGVVSCRSNVANAAPKSKAVFLDRDGTLIEDKDYLKSPEEVVLFPGAAEALRALHDAGYLLVLVTNQSGVGRGYFSLEDVFRVHEHLQSLLAAGGVRLDSIYVAPEAPGQPILGRKPSPRFLLDARDSLGIDLARSYMVGDKAADVECGRRAGVASSILVRTGYGARTERELGEGLEKVVVVDDLAAAAAWVLGGGEL